MEKGHKTIRKKGSPPESDLFLKECDPLSDELIDLRDGSSG